MFHEDEIPYEDKKKFYHELNDRLAALIDGEPSLTANLANAAALLFLQLPRINWAGFYLFDGVELVLGPFQGRPACIRIALGKGACGIAARQREIQLVGEVNEFPTYIACDAATRSEIVIPIMEGGELKGVLDIDSPLRGRFNEEDAEGLREFVETLELSGCFSSTQNS